jgi:hypothetical protein
MQGETVDFYKNMSGRYARWHKISYKDFIDVHNVFKYHPKYSKKLGSEFSIENILCIPVTRFFGL